MNMLCRIEDTARGDMAGLLRGEALPGSPDRPGLFPASRAHAVRRSTSTRSIRKTAIRLALPLRRVNASRAHGRTARGMGGAGVASVVEGWRVGMLRGDAINDREKRGRGRPCHREPRGPWS
jgi:hypothetical protein